MMRIKTRLKERLSGKVVFVISATTVIALMFPVIFHLVVNSKPRGDIKKATFSRLERIRETKKQEIADYFSDVQKLASGIGDDKMMLKFFNSLQQENYKADSNFEYEIDKYYVDEYGSFYDILFIDSKGYVFHSIKKESDYQKNLFKGDLSRTKLAKKLKHKRDEYFVDYEFYSPSDEPASFFVVPLREESKHIGWFVLQCSTNKVNTMLADREGLARTGEVYLVNKEKMMLSDSRFMEDSTILKLKIDTSAVKEALRNKRGEAIIRDYRGIRVFSSFKEFGLFGTSWIIIAEIDEDEVITEQYKKHKKYFREEIGSYLAGRKYVKHAPQNVSGKKKRVDMNEFAKSTPGTALQTSGVSDCTVVAILFPNKFGYLAHVSPTDEIYLSDTFTRLFLGENKSDFLGGLIKRVTYYDLRPCELKKLQFVIIASHSDSLGNAVDKIVANGIELANIRFLYNPNARGANVLLDVDDGSVEVEWYSKNSVFLEYASEVEDLGTVVKKIIRYDI